MTVASTMRSDNPTVTVVVPCRNDARYLTSSLKSILSQDYPHVECIVVDGGSSDATPELLATYGDRIRWVSEPDRGAFDAINRGWQMSTGEILTWLNADDVWLPGAARAVVEFLRHRPEVDVAYGAAGVIDEIGRAHGELIPRAWDLEYALLHCDHMLYQPAAFIRRPMLEQIGWLYPAWCHDHDLWLRIARAGGRFAYLPACLAMDRLRTNNLGGLAELVVPAKIELTKRFFAAPDLPPAAARLRQRAISNAYLRGMDYLVPGARGHWSWGMRLAADALRADPRNMRAVVERASRPLRGRLGTLLRGPVRKLVTLYPLRRAAGWAVAGALGNATRDIDARVETLGRRIRTIETATAEGVEALRTARRADLDASRRERAELLGAIDELRREHADAVDALRQRHRAALDELRTAHARNQTDMLHALHTLRDECLTLRQELEAERAPRPVASDRSG